MKNYCPKCKKTVKAVEKVNALVCSKCRTVVPKSIGVLPWLPNDTGLHDKVRKIADKVGLSQIEDRQWGGLIKKGDEENPRLISPCYASMVGNKDCVWFYGEDDSMWWKTSPVSKVAPLPNFGGYRITTQNSIYYLVLDRSNYSVI